MWTVWITSTEAKLIHEGKIVEKLLEDGLVSVREGEEGGYSITYLTEDEAGLRLTRGP